MGPLPNMEEMNMSNTSRNYHAHGGNQWVIGGRLTFLPGAVVEGLEGLFDQLPAAELIEHTPPFVPDSTATTVAALHDDFNGLLAALREAGILAASEEQTKVEQAEAEQADATDEQHTDQTDASE